MIPGELTAFQPDIWQCWRTTIGGARGPRWDWQALSYPYWRIYWNEAPGAWVTFEGVDFAAKAKATTSHSLLTSLILLSSPMRTRRTSSSSLL